VQLEAYVRPLGESRKGALLPTDVIESPSLTFMAPSHPQPPKKAAISAVFAPGACTVSVGQLEAHTDCLG